MKKSVFNGKISGKSKILFWAAGAVFVFAQAVQAQGILGSNLIVNGNAEAGSAGKSPADIVAIPNWTSAGGITALPYDLTGYVLSGSPAPPQPGRGFQYFAGAHWPNPVTMSQNIDVSSGASVIGTGNVKFTATAYLGGGGEGPSPTMEVAFKNASGQTFGSITLGPVSFGTGMYLQQQIGLVPAGTATITVTLGFLGINGGYSAIDSASLVLNTLGTTPASVLGTNLITNGNAEAGTSAPPQSVVGYVPGWSTAGGASVCSYGGKGWIQLTSAGPADRGVNLFCGYAGGVGGPSSSYQDIDVSAAASLIDAGQIDYQVGAWLGGVAIATRPTLTYYFYDWTGKQLAATAQLGGTGVSVTGLVSFSHTDVLPAGTRHVHIALSFPNYSSLADDISFTIGNLGAPTITSGGIVPVYSTATTIQPGSWVSIFGTGLASATTTWTGDFPTMLGGTSVTIDSNPAYLWLVSPTQINLQAPDDTATGTVSVVVTTSAGSTTSTVTLGQYAPSFSLYNSKYAAAIVPTVGTPGNSGNGYDYIGPGGNGLPFTSRPLKPGETVLLYGVGFGPTTPVVPAGAAFSGAAPVPVLPTVTIGGVPATVTFAGIVEAGLYQLNVVVPSAGSGDKALLATVGGATTPANVFITLQ
jgi:uncharacterized protein (TIGR03437 family)